MQGGNSVSRTGTIVLLACLSLELGLILLTSPVARGSVGLGLMLMQLWSVHLYSTGNLQPD